MNAGRRPSYRASADYELAINRKAGKTLGVAIPQSLVLCADKVIE